LTDGSQAALDRGRQAAQGKHVLKALGIFQ
jgi:hypothetical protein